ncbi:hypothetical protein GF376_01760 [Candidatus Peregrinibacteria bacterium]|nr:hypothetical protein [Candidatus Peregrinibacteria bacterium]
MEKQKNTSVDLNYIFSFYYELPFEMALKYVAEASDQELIEFFDSAVMDLAIGKFALHEFGVNNLKTDPSVLQGGLVIDLIRKNLISLLHLRNADEANDQEYVMNAMDAHADDEETLLKALIEKGYFVRPTVSELKQIQSELKAEELELGEESPEFLTRSLRKKIEGIEEDLKKQN